LQLFNGQSKKKVPKFNGFNIERAQYL